MPDDPTTPPRPPFLGGRVYIPSDVHGAKHWRRDFTAEPKLHRLLALVFASFDDGFISIDALHLLDELVGGPPTWRSKTEPEPPPEGWQHAASIEGPRGLVHFIHQGEEVSRAALAKLVNSATVLAERPELPEDDDATEEDLDLGGMVVEADPVESCLGLVGDAIGELVQPGFTPTLTHGEWPEPFRVQMSPEVSVVVTAPRGGALAKSLLYVTEAIASTQAAATQAAATKAAQPPPSLAAALEDPAWLTGAKLAEPAAADEKWVQVATTRVLELLRASLWTVKTARCHGGRQDGGPVQVDLGDLRITVAAMGNSQGTLGGDGAAALQFAEALVKLGEALEGDLPWFGGTPGCYPPPHPAESAWLPSMAQPAPTASTPDVPTVTLGSSMPPIMVRWLVVDEDGECVCYVLAASENDARRRAEEQGSEPEDRVSPDPYMLDDWNEDRPLLVYEGALIHARRRHLTWKLLEAIKRDHKRDHLRLGEDPDDKGLWWWEGRTGLLNSNDTESGGLIKLLWDCQAASPDEALLKLGPVLQSVQADTAPPSYRPAYDGKLQIGRATFWVGPEFDGVAKCLLLLAQACVDPGFRLPEELPASEVPTVELPAPLVADMADAVGLTDDDVPDEPVTKHDGYTRIRGAHTETTTTLLWQAPHKQADQLEVTCRIPGDLLREALGISTEELLRARRRDTAERALDTALLNLTPAPGCSDEAVTISESEDGTVCVSLHGRALVAADEEGAKVLRALGDLFQDHHIKF